MLVSKLWTENFNKEEVYIYHYDYMYISNRFIRLAPYLDPANKRTCDIRTGHKLQAAKKKNERRDRISRVYYCDF